MIFGLSRVMAYKLSATVSLTVLLVSTGFTRADGPVDKAAGAHKTSPTGVAYPKLPEAVASFGATISGDWLYVYSGHIGSAHQHSTANLSRGFHRLNLRELGSWDKLPMPQSLQSVALVEHDGKVYRVGGMSARNRSGEPEDMHSVRDFARFDPDARTWATLTPLPEGRSSHDAAILGDHLYVVGGWRLAGDSDGHWTDTALRINLKAKEPRWEELPRQPFQRRALAVATARGKIYVLGGMDDAGDITTAVSVYDPRARRWSSGPKLPGKGMSGFGVSACGVGKEIFASGMNGKVYRLSAAGDEWQEAGQLQVPRFFHRLLPRSVRTLLAVGGASMRFGHLRIIEPINVDPTSARLSSTSKFPLLAPRRPAPTFLR